MSRPLALAAGLALLAASACSGGSSPTTTPQTYTVLVDGHAADSPVAFTAFFPKVIRVHAGDTVVFSEQYSGLPHTVALGRAVDRALKRIDALAASDPAALNAGPPPEYAVLPRLLAGGDANQSAAQPCVVGTTGSLPSGEACKDKHVDEYAGRQQLVSSGWLAPDQHWSVRFARSTKPGTYRFLCQVHGPSMSGAVHIVPSSQSVKSPAAVTAEGAAARVAVLQRVQPGFATLAGRPATEPLAGSGDPSSPEALITAFGPRDVKVPVGGVVSWTVIGTHSIAFNAPPDAIGLRQQDPDGSVHVSRPASVPAGGVGANAGTQQAVIDGGSWDGRGFRSSGLVFGPPPPNTTSFRLRFTRAGKYTLVCTVHPAMTGSVTVG